MNNLDEREISLIDLIYYLLRRYRSILLIMVIGALLVTSGAYIKTNHLTSESDYLEYEEELVNYQKDTELLNIYTDKLKENQDMLFNKPLISITNNMPTATITLRINSNNNKTSNDSQTIIENIISTINNDNNLNTISDKYSVNRNYVYDLYSLIPDYDSQSLVINAYGKNLNSASNLLKDITDIVDESLITILNNYNNYEIAKEHGLSYIDNAWKDDTQEKAQSSITYYTNLINSINNKYNGKGKPEAPDYFSIKDGIKFALIGAFVGLVLMVGIYCVIYMLNDFIREEDEIHSYFGFSNLGTFAVKDDNPKSNKLDKFLLKKQYGDLDDEFVVNRIAENVNLLSKEDNKILLIGNIEDNVLNNLYNQLNAKVNKGKLIIGGNINKDNEALTKLSDVNSIILVEKRNYSKMKDILKEAEIVKNCGKNVIGYIQY